VAASNHNNHDHVAEFRPLAAVSTPIQPEQVTLELRTSPIALGITPGHLYGLTPVQQAAVLTAAADTLMQIAEELVFPAAVAASPAKPAPALVVAGGRDV
jgi:hypothetical protein